MKLEAFIDNLNMEKCPIHNEGPCLTLQNNKVIHEKELCCNDFREYCENHIVDFVANKAADDAANKIAGLFDRFDSL